MEAKTRTQKNVKVHVRDRTNTQQRPLAFLCFSLFYLDASLQTAARSQTASDIVSYFLLNLKHMIIGEKNKDP